MKLFNTVSLCMAFSFVCLSCSKDNPNTTTSQDIIGKWVVTYACDYTFEESIFDFTENALTVTYSNGFSTQLPIEIDREKSTIMFSDGKKHFKSYLSGFIYYFSEENWEPGPHRGQLCLVDNIQFPSAYYYLSKK